MLKVVMLRLPFLKGITWDVTKIILWISCCYGVGILRSWWVMIWRLRIVTWLRWLKIIRILAFRMGNNVGQLTGQHLLQNTAKFKSQNVQKDASMR